MKDIKKTIALVKNELKCNLGGELVVALMLAVMMICANIMTATISDYIDSLMYLMNPKAGNAVIIYDTDGSADFDAVRADPEVEFGIEVKCYNDYDVTVCAVSKDILKDDLSFLSKENIETLKNDVENNGDLIPMIVSASTGYSIGKKGTLMDGSQYEVVGIIDNDEVKYLILPLQTFDNFGIVIDKGQLEGLTPFSPPIMFTGLAKGTSKENFKEKYNEKGLPVGIFDPLDALSGEYSDSITISVIGITTFTISLFGVIINCYLVFGNRRKYYRTLMTVGAKKEIFLQSGAIIKLTQLVISLALTAAGLAVCNLIIGEDLFSALGIAVSALLAVLLITLSWFLLKGWLGKVSCLES
ncbi:MAG: hypothetical protein HDT44_10170 [Ruminococcaceae bacterium]|nr:hypothetical protein [Oscillospiraceae bacterium]